MLAVCVVSSCGLRLSLSFSPMGSGTSRSKVTTPVTPWSYSPEPDSPSHDRFNPHRLNSAQRLDAIAKLVEQQERYTQPPSHLINASNGLDDQDDRFQVPLFIEPSTPVKSELSDLQEIQDLQNTFDSLGIPETKIDEREDRWIGVKDNESMRLMDVGRVFGPECLTDDGRISSTDRVSSTKSFHSEPDSQNRGFKTLSKKAVSAPLSLHKWAPAESVQDDEWVYNKKEIDGFDPDKFRRVNSQKKNMSTYLSAYNSSRLSPGGTPPHPHSMPDYDEAEERIVGSIEREYSY